MTAKIEEYSGNFSTSSVSANPGERGKNIQVVIFSLGDEQFAIDLFDVKEVVEYTTITKVPNMQSFIQGIIDLRGEITTIVDLKQRLNIDKGTKSSLESSRIIVLDEKITTSKIGILVDDVTSVSTFETQEVDYSSTARNRENTSIIGIIRRTVKIKEKACNELIIWIDIRQLLQDFRSFLK